VVRLLCVVQTFLIFGMRQNRDGVVCDFIGCKNTFFSEQNASKLQKQQKTFIIFVSFVDKKSIETRISSFSKPIFFYKQWIFIGFTNYPIGYFSL
jgi:hypothetical protein